MPEPLIRSAWTGAASHTHLRPVYAVPLYSHLCLCRTRFQKYVQSCILCDFTRSALAQELNRHLDFDQAAHPTLRRSTSYEYTNPPFEHQ